jgi:hypothetical protein
MSHRSSSIRSVWITLTFIVFIQSFASGQWSQPNIFYRHETSGNLKVQITDIDGDGIWDIVYDSRKPVLAWFKGNGDGTFSRSNVIMEGPYYSDADFMLVEGGNGSVLFFCERNGAGGVSRYSSMVKDSFGQWEMVGQFDLPFQYHSAQMCHLGSDELPDVIAVQGQVGSGDNLYALTNVSNTGVEALLLAQIDKHVILDVDQNGFLDVIYSVSQEVDSLLIRLNNGDGTWGDPQFLGNYPMSVFLMWDHDQDGHKDLCMGVGADLGVLHSDGNGWFAPDVTLLGLVGGSAPTRYLKAADMNGDGLEDIVWSRGMNSYHTGVVLNQGVGTYSVLPTVSGICSEIWDLDGNGSLELIVHNSIGNGLLSAIFNPATASPLVQPLSTVLQGGSLTMIDETCNGSTDMIVGQTGHYYRFSNSSTPHQGPGYTGRLLFADVDGDGCPDRISYQTNGTGLHVRYNDGEGGFGIPQLFYADSAPISTVGAADLNNNGIIDILIGSNAPNQAYQAFILMDMDASGPASTITMNSVSAFDEVIFHDFDSDGDLDVILIGSFGGSNFRRNNGNGTLTNIGSVGGRVQCFIGNSVYWINDTGLRRTFTSQINMASPSTLILPGSDIVEVRAWDMNADGLADLVIRYADQSPSLDVLLSPISAGASPYQIHHGVPSVFGIGARDHDGDGDLDLYVLGLRELWLLSNYSASQFSIHGHVYLDLNGDGVDVVPAPNIHVHSAPATSVGLTASEGAYMIYAEPGEFTVAAQAPNANWTVSPALSEISLTEAEPVASGQDHYLVPLEQVSDLVPHQVLGGALCNTSTPIWLTVQNAGTIRDQGILKLVLDTLWTFNGSIPIPDLVDGNHYEWHFEDLLPFSNFSVELVLMGPDVSAIGAALNDTLIVESISSVGSEPVVVTSSVMLLCAYDPNDKQVEPEGHGAHHAVSIETDKFHYNVRFQNTGTAPATNVMIVDPVDMDLDLSTIAVVGASHDLSYVVITQDRDLQFHFNGIMLPDSNADLLGSQGYIRYSIAPVTGSSHLTVISNTAAIYFDMNPPIITNTVHNTLVDCNEHAPVVVDQGDGLLWTGLADEYQWYIDDQPMTGETGQSVSIAGSGSYNVWALDQYGCEAFSSALDIIVTSVRDQEGTSYTLFPNPAHDLVRFVSNEVLHDHHELVLTDQLGRRLKNWRGTGTNEIVLELGRLSSSMYLLHLLIDGRPSATMKLLVQ